MKQEAAQSRRSFLTLLGSTAALSGVGLASAGGETGGAVRRVDSGGTEQSTGGDGSPVGTGRESLVGVELVGAESGDRHQFEDHGSIDRTELDGGRYDVVGVYREDGTVVERIEDSIVSSTETVTNGTDVRALVPTRHFEGSIRPNDTVRVHVGSVETAGGNEVGIAGSVETSVVLTGPDDQRTDDEEITTDDDGNAIVEFELDDADTGRYTVEVTSPEAESAGRDFFWVGPKTGVVPLQGAMTPGEETQLGVASVLGGEPEDQARRSIEIGKPDGSSETREVEIDDGMGWLTLTPEQVGTYDFNGPVHSAHRSLGSGIKKALIEPGYLGAQSSNDHPKFAGILFEDGQPITDEDLIVHVSGDQTGEFRTTTNDFGQFELEMDVGWNQHDSLEVQLETVDGERVYHEQTDIIASSTYEDTQEVEVEIRPKRNVVAPGDSVSVEIKVFDEDSEESVTDAAVDVLGSYSYDAIPFAQDTIETDSDGVAAKTFQLPETAPDGEFVSFEAIVEVDGHSYHNDGVIDIERHEVRVQRNASLSPGETGTLEVEARDRKTGDPVDGVQVVGFANRGELLAETVAADSVETGTDGSAELSLEVPGEDGDLDLATVTPYSWIDRSFDVRADPFQVDLSVSKRNVSPGDEIELQYEVDTDEDVSALLRFEVENALTVRTLEPDEETTVQVPDDAKPADDLSLEIAAVTRDGDIVTTRSWLQLVEGKAPAASFEASNANPVVGETVTFDASGSIDPDGEIVTYAWNIDGGVRADAFGEQVSHTFESEGEYDVTLLVYDDDDNLDGVTETVTVESDDVDDAVDRADRNGDGEIDSDELQQAIREWASGEYTTAELQAIISAWVTGG